MRLNRRETWLVVGLLVASVLLWAPYAVMRAALRADDGDETAPRRTPLADLCVWLPYPEIVRLVPEPRDPDSYAIFGNGVQCDWRSGDKRTTLGLNVYRPHGSLTPEKEISDARDFYDRRASAHDGEGGPAGVGEVSRVSVQRGSDYTEAHVIARDGLLVLQVTYRVPGKKADIAGKARGAAAELLRALPPKGR
ncbi:hypothetical protein ACFVH6_15245 [Spirillospora sp. NPDC127200]